MGPRVDGDYLPAQPEILMVEGRHKVTEVISGVTADEGGLLALREYWKTSFITRWNDCLADWAFDILQPVIDSWISKRNCMKICVAVTVTISCIIDASWPFGASQWLRIARYSHLIHNPSVIHIDLKHFWVLPSDFRTRVYCIMTSWIGVGLLDVGEWLACGSGEKNQLKSRRSCWFCNHYQVAEDHSHVTLMT